MSTDPALDGGLRDIAAAFEAVDDSCLIGIFDAEHRAVYLNGRFCALSGFSLEDLLTADDAARGPDVFAEAWRTVDEGRVWRGTLDANSKDGTPYRLAATVTRLDRPDGQRYLTVCRELRDDGEGDPGAGTFEGLAAITDRFRADQRSLAEIHAAQVQREKLSSLGMLASAIAHEINNPLAGVMACVKAIREETIPEERREEYFDAIQDALLRIRDTVASVLSYARPSRGAPGPVDGAELITSSLVLISPVLGRRNIEVVVTFARNRVTIEGKRAELMQSIINVLLNAVHASPSDSRIEVTAERVGANRVALSFQDHGTGIPPDVLPRVCEPFFTTKPGSKGTGLGLSITRRIIQEHGGELHIESELGEGTRVTFELPGHIRD